MPAKFRSDSPLPIGTVTFLFTDIEGSTTLWEQYPDAMRVALARHDGLLRDAIESADGHIIKTTGDGMLAVFSAAADALAACLGAQRALQAPAEPGLWDPRRPASDIAPATLRVRMGLHTGVAELRDGDYFGASLNRAARIMSAAHGEQVLLSAATAEMIRGHLPEGVTLREMGEHQLKGLPGPERLLQIVAPDLRADFPPLASLTGYSLPAERDAFVGRDEALAELTRRLDTGARLVSVLGLGGTGKTRLVTRFGWSALRSFPGGVWFCDLSQARSLDGIVYAVAQGLDVPLGKDDPVTQLGHAIAGRGQCLMILDNFEQVTRHAEETLGRWLNRASTARFLVTTREVLELPGEEILALSPLAPSEAAALFMRRAEAAKPGFQPSAEDQSAIAPLMKLLEGLPLAIELAAARVRVMPPRMLLARMSERFKLLSSAGGRLGRQATLRAVFDWSWDLLSMPEKAALAQLSVFEGGFTLEAVEAVLDLTAYENAPWPIDALQTLVQKSLVRHGSGDRFDLLMSVQEYASEHLRTADRYAESGPAAMLAAQERHAAYFAGLDHNAVAADSFADVDNFVAACRRAAARGDAEVAAHVLEGAWAALSLRGPFKVGSDLASAVLATPGLKTAARVHWIAGRALAASGKDSDAQGQFEASLAQARRVSDRISECRARIDLAARDSHAGRMDAAREHLETALVIAAEMKDFPLQSDAHDGLGKVEVFLGRTGEARTEFEKALALAREAGDREREGRILANLGVLHFHAGSMDEARSHDEAALAVAQGIANRQLEGNVRCNLGLLHQVQGRFSDALEQLEAALAVARDLGHARLECIVLCNLGMVYDSLARFDEARDSFEAALAVARELGDRHSEGQFLSYLGRLHARQANFDEARRCLDSSETLLRAVSDRTSLGILLCSRAETEQLAVCPDAAHDALAAAELIAAEVGAGPDSELGLALARVRGLCRLRGTDGREFEGGAEYPREADTVPGFSKTNAAAP
ncbi:MAG TPA: tetratricopeptide repeat protein [Casimicrobiaceae bacterium]|nr:tetratricopeptide repeat protein [Casimicrobiaceae bacterium]